MGLSASNHGSKSLCFGADGVVRAITFHQPNGYLQIADSTIIANALGWPQDTYPYNDSVALFMGGGSLNVVNCECIEHFLSHCPLRSYDLSQAISKTRRLLNTRLPAHAWYA